MHAGNCYLSFDIGGTNIKYGVVTSEGDILEKGNHITPNSGKAILQTLADIHTELARQYSFIGVACSIPGFVNVDTGYLPYGGAITDFYGINFKEALEPLIGLNVELENDVNCVAMAEKWLGNGRDSDSFICITLGTGVGGAIYFNNQLLRGHKFMAGEFGFMLTHNLFSERHNVAATMSQTASVRGGLRRPYAKIKALPSYEGVSGKDVFNAAEKEDTEAQKVIETFYENVAIGLYNLTFILNPQKILVGGAISGRDEIYPRIIEKFQYILDHEDSVSGTKVSELVEIQPTKFNNDSGLIGAVAHYMAMQEQRHKSETA